MSFLLQSLFFVLVLATIYASYVHNREWYHEVLGMLADLFDPASYRALKQDIFFDK